MLSVGLVPKLCKNSEYDRQALLYVIPNLSDNLITEY
jgi:hypothetical protein